MFNMVHTSPLPGKGRDERRMRDTRLSTKEYEQSAGEERKKKSKQLCVFQSKHKGEYIYLHVCRQD